MCANKINNLKQLLPNKCCLIKVLKFLTLLTVWGNWILSQLALGKLADLSAEMVRLYLNTAPRSVFLFKNDLKTFMRSYKEAQLTSNNDLQHYPSWTTPTRNVAGEKLLKVLWLIYLKNLYCAVVDQTIITSTTPANKQFYAPRPQSFWSDEKMSKSFS